MNVQVEKLCILTRDGDRRLVAGEVTDVGPSRMQVTWNFLANLSLLASQYAMPFARLGKLVSTPVKRFTAAKLSRHYAFVAEHFVAIYRHLGLTLATAPVLAGDDTPSQVLEVSRALAREGEWSAEPPPWANYATQDRARHTCAQGPAGLAATLAQTFGFAFARKAGGGDKRGFNTTVLSGRANPADPRSTIVFYRSHLGGLGNLLDVILPHRPATQDTLVVQADLATVNLISEPSVLRQLQQRHLAGCSAHARRPFALYEQDDPENCERILHMFKGIPIYEHALDVVGRNTTNTLAVRQADQAACWATGLATSCGIGTS